MTHRRSPRVLASPLLLASLVGAAFAARADDDVLLGSIVITAQKRSEEMIKVPISAMAMDQSTLDELGVKDVSDLARIAPGVTLQSTNDYGDTNIAIRGIVSDVGASTTGIYIDEVPVMSRPYDTIGGNPYPKVFDLDRIEVLRGPQGTLFGAGAEGGALRFITPEASLRKYTGFASADLATTRGGDPSYEAGAAAGGPIVEGKMGYRASVWHREDGGIGNRVDPATGTELAQRGNGSGSTAAHLNLKFAASPDLIITPGVFYQSTHTGDVGMYLESAGDYTVSSRISQPHDDHFALSTLVVDYDFGAFTFKSVSSYLDRTIQQTWDSTSYELSSLLGGATSAPFDPNYLVVTNYDATQRGVTQEFRFSSANQAGDRLSWVGGVFYRKDVTNYHARYIDPNFDTLSNYLSVQGGYGPSDSLGYFGEAPLPGNIVYFEDYPTTETDLAAYADLTYNLTSSVKLAGGVRIARSGFSYTDFQDGPWGPAAPLQLSGSAAETPITPRLNLSWQIDAQRMVYVGAAKGYRSGGANEPVPVNQGGGCGPDLASLGLTQVPASYGSDSLWSFETGAKGRFFDNKVLIESSLYWINWNQIQQNVYLANCGYNYIANLGHAVSRGFDLQAEWAATRHLVFSFTSGYTDAHLTDTILLDGNMLAKSGDRLSTPTWTVTGGGEYRYSLGSGADGYARVDYDFNGSYNRMGSIDTFGSDPLIRYAPPVRLLSARLGAKMGEWDLALYGNNLLDRDTSLYRFRASIDSTDLRDVRLRPRTIGVSAKYTFR